jgi:hypothetical protein
MCKGVAQMLGAYVLFKMTQTYQAQQPRVGRGASVVKNDIAHAFYHLVAPFGWVLVLMVWFTLPGRYAICMKDVTYSHAGFHFSTVTDQFCRHSTVNNLIHKYTQKRGQRFHPMYI